MPTRFTSQRFPYLPIRLVIGSETFDIEALLDTGFDDDILVPASLLGDRHSPTNYQQYTLADGSTVKAPYFVGSVEIGPFGPFPVAVSGLGSEPLVGLGVARHLIITLVHGQEIIVEP